VDALLVLCLAVIVLVWGALLGLPPRPRREVAIADGPGKSDVRASERLVSLIDLLFALVLTLPVVVSQDVVRAPWHGNIPVVLALVLGYYVVIRSYIDWHVAMEDAPYWIRSGSHKSAELRRVYVDFLIVMAYVLLLLSTKDLTTNPDSDIGEFLSLFFVVFALYLVWGALRSFAYGPLHEFRWLTLAIALIGFAAIWGAYRLDRNQVRWLHNHTTLNTVALVLAFAMYSTYRMRNWREMRPGHSLATTAPQAAGGDSERLASPSTGR
jgi:hypothetical protein